ncbi:hypothetical protein EAG_15733 [Camponotus floridanus]|uniref:Uncharacterized protein n=1 Tax=Camponotus floridanus TaxID=104421 RepID=E2AXC4_CAMFO|nr:hypothetical protein EAG_15733 [Camponotus floridanus]
MNMNEGHWVPAFAGGHHESHCPALRLFVRVHFSPMGGSAREVHMHMLWNTSPTCTCRSRKKEPLTPFSPGEEETSFHTDRTKKNRRPFDSDASSLTPPSCFFTKLPYFFITNELYTKRAKLRSDRVAALGRPGGCNPVWYLRFRCPIRSAAASFHQFLDAERQTYPHASPAERLLVSHARETEFRLRQIVVHEPSLGTRSRYRRDHHEGSFRRWAPTRKRIRPGKQKAEDKRRNGIRFLLGRFEPFIIESETPFVHRGIFLNRHVTLFVHTSASALSPSSFQGSDLINLIARRLQYEFKFVKYNSLSLVCPRTFILMDRTPGDKDEVLAAGISLGGWHSCPLRYFHYGEHYVTATRSREHKRALDFDILDSFALVKMNQQSYIIRNALKCLSRI